jgi:patatin-like phospholipase/acyl hydrolase
MATNILSIDGGGTRGLFPATVLTEIEKATGKKITEIFDVIIGSATGGIIASALAAGIDIEVVQDIYLNKAKSILPYEFKRQFFLLNPLNLFRSKYSNEGLKKELNRIIGADETLNTVHDRFGEDTIFLFPSLSLNPIIGPRDITSFQPVIFNSAYHRDKAEKLIDVALKTSAAVINLPVYDHHIEGGNYANDPSVFGLSFALDGKQDTEGVSRLSNGKLGLGKSADDIRLLSLGCGSDGKSYISKSKLKGRQDWGLLKWQAYLISLVIDSNMVANQYLSRQILPEGNFLRINAYYKDHDAPEILRNKKLAIDVTDPEQLKAIKQYAEETFERQQAEILGFI